MMCLSPVTVPRKSWHMTKTGKYSYDFDGHYISVPCGHCVSCLKKKRDNWRVRLVEELKYNKCAYFFTLTYDDKYLPTDSLGFAHVNKCDVQKFFKRLRKLCSGICRVRYFFISEYGPETMRPHYHGIIYFDELFDVNQVYEIIKKSWSLGFITIGPVIPERIGYIVNYAMKIEDIPNWLKPNFMLCSRKPAIGAQFLESELALKLKNEYLNYYPYEDKKLPLPRYFKDRLFNTYEKQFMLSKLEIIPLIEKLIAIHGDKKTAYAVMSKMTKQFIDKQKNNLKNRRKL